MMTDHGMEVAQIIRRSINEALTEHASTEAENQ